MLGKTCLGNYLENLTIYLQNLMDHYAKLFVELGKLVGRGLLGNMTCQVCGGHRDGAVRRRHKSQS